MSKRCVIETLLAYVCLWLVGSSNALAGQPIEEKVPGQGSYKLYLPGGPKARKAPLVVWLHPAGAEANELVIKWWPDLHDLGYALMLPKSENARFWRFEEEKKLLAYVDHAAAKHKVNAKRVVLLGYSAGGQMAFFMGMKRAERLAGIVTMSAVPVKGMHDLSTALPPKQFKESLAYFMVLGEQEEAGVRIAKRAQLELLADGFSALLHVVKDAGHAFHASEKGAVLEWLGEVAEGKRPAIEELKDLAKTAADDIKAYRVQEAQSRAEHEKKIAAAKKVFEDVEGNLGKPYTLKWRRAGQVEQGGKVQIELPKGWSVGEQSVNGESAAVMLDPPEDDHVVAFLGRSVKAEGLVKHYQKWLAEMDRKNHRVNAKGGKMSINGREWNLYTFSVVPHKKAHEPEARRVLVVALSVLNQKGTAWRSLTVMCPEHECTKHKLAELVRGILEKSTFVDAKE